MKSYTTYDDSKLLHLVTAGDETAFTELYDRYWKLFFYVAHKRLKVFSESEEIVQDVFADLWKRRSTIRIESSFRYYMAAAIQYQVIRQLSRRKNNLSAEFIDLPDPISYTSTDQPILIKELEQRLQKLVAALPEKCRLVYALKREEGLSNAQIAQKLGISEKTVENQMTKALGRIRDGLGDAGLMYVIIAILQKK